VECYNLCKKLNSWDVLLDDKLLLSANIWIWSKQLFIYTLVFWSINLKKID